jgi:hypothetical protein
MTIAPALAELATFWTILAVVGTQLTPAMPMIGLYFPALQKYRM